MPGRMPSQRRPVATKSLNALKPWSFGIHGESVFDMLNDARSIVSLLARRFRGSAVPDLANTALRHQLHGDLPRLSNRDRLRRRSPSACSEDGARHTLQPVFMCSLGYRAGTFP